MVAIILALGPISGAHLNPAISLASRLLARISNKEMFVFWIAQLAGATAGTVIANLMFALPAIELSSKVRFGYGLWLGEVIATFGLVLVIFTVVRSGQLAWVAIAVGAYIAGAYWFTSSTSFTNPAVTLSRTLTPSFAGIAPGSVVPFLTAELLGALAAVVTLRLFYPTDRNDG